MSKTVVLMLLILLVLSGLVMVGSVFGQSTPTPSVPEFTVELVEHSSYVPPVYGIDQFTGENITMKEGAHYQWSTLNFTIRNQKVPSDYNLYYNIRYKGQYTDNWTELFLEGDSYMRQDEGEYSTEEFLVSGSIPPSQRDLYRLEIPEGAQVDFQVEAMIGGIYRQGSWFSAGDVFEGEVSGWSATQTLTIEEVPTPSPEATPIEPALILGVIGIVAVFVFGLVLLYRIKRK